MNADCYPDPSDPNRQRFWDGANWTRHVYGPQGQGTDDFVPAGPPPGVAPELWASAPPAAGAGYGGQAAGAGYGSSGYGAPGYGAPGNGAPGGGGYGQPGPSASPYGYSSPSATPPAYGSPYVSPYAAPGFTPVQGNGLATASLVLGLCAIVVEWAGLLTLAAALLAVIFGVIGMKRARAMAGQFGAGRGRAIAGLILGSVAVAAYLAWGFGSTWAFFLV